MRARLDEYDRAAHPGEPQHQAAQLLGGGAQARLRARVGRGLERLRGAARDHQYAFSDFSSDSGVFARIMKSSISDQFSM